MKLLHILRRINENVNAVEFNISHEGVVSGQDDYKLTAVVDGQTVAYLEYSEYDGEVYANYITVSDEFRRRGIAKKMMQYLQKQYPDTEIQLGMTTDDGTKLANALDRKFIPNREYEDIVKKIDTLKRKEDAIQKEIDSGDYSRGDEFNEISDSIYDLEQELDDLPKGSWIIQ